MHRIAGKSPAEKQTGETQTGDSGGAPPSCTQQTEEVVAAPVATLSVRDWPVVGIGTALRLAATRLVTKVLQICHRVGILREPAAVLAFSRAHRSVKARLKRSDGEVTLQPSGVRYGTTFLWRHSDRSRSKLALRFGLAGFSATVSTERVISAGGVQSTEYRVQRAESREQRAESGERRAESREQRAESREWRAESRELRAESREQRAAGSEQRTESGEQRVESRELRTESREW